MILAHLVSVIEQIPYANGHHQSGHLAGFWCNSGQIVNSCMKAIALWLGRLKYFILCAFYTHIWYTYIVKSIIYKPPASSFSWSNLLSPMCTHVFSRKIPGMSPETWSGSQGKTWCAHEILRLKPLLVYIETQQMGENRVCPQTLLFPKGKYSKVW